MRSIFFYESLKDIAKRLVVNCLNIHRDEGKKNIIILSSPRSGSTWLMETLNVASGTKYIYEPLAKHITENFNKKYPLIGIPSRFRYSSLSESESIVMKDYFFSKRKMNFCAQSNIFSKDYKFVTNRMIIKIIRANALVEWFANELEAHVVYLIRHPIAQSLSCIKRGKSHIGCHISEYMQNEIFVRENLNNELMMFIEGIQEKGSDLEKYVTEWCLSNMIALKHLNSNSWVVITYEELVLKYHEIINMLFKSFDMQIKKGLSLKEAKPSKTSNSSTVSTREGIIKGEKKYLIEKWKNGTTYEQQKNIFNILHMFEIDAYKLGEFLPHKNLLHFLHK